MADMDLTFRYPPVVAGGAVAPTVAQMIGRNRVVVDASTDAGAKEDDTPVAHSMNCPTAGGTDSFPEVFITCLSNGIVLTGLSYAYTDANTITLTKIIKGANTAAIFRVVIKRPHSIGL